MKCKYCGKEKELMVNLDAKKVKALSSALKNIGKEAFDKILADNGFRSVEDVKTNEQADKLNTMCFEYFTKNKAKK